MKWLRKLFFFISLCKSDGILQADPSWLVDFFSSSLRSTCFDIWPEKNILQTEIIFFLSPKMAWGTYDIIYCYLKLTFWKYVRVVILYLYNIDQENIY